MAKWCGLVGLLLWAIATTAAAWANGHGIRTEPVELGLADGTKIYGVLYRAETSTATSPGAVVLHGTATSHSSCAPSISIPLARSGVTVLAIDLRGHGRSEGAVAPSEYYKLHAMLRDAPEQPDVDAAIAFLRGQPGVDPKKIVLVGFSRGGWMAAIGGLRDPDVAGVVAVSSAPTFCDLNKPHNLMMLAGGLDYIIPSSQYRSAFSRATAGEGQEGLFFGDFGLGTARYFILSDWSMHLSALAEPVTTERIVQWVGWSTLHHPGTDHKIGLFITLAALWLALPGAFLAAYWLVALLAGSLLGLPTPASDGRTALARRMLMLLMLPVPAIAATVQHLIPDGALLFGSHAIALLLTAGLVALVFGMLVSFLRPGRAEVATGLRVLANGAAVGILASALELILGGSFLTATWIDFSLTPRRLEAGWLYVLILVPCCLLLSIGIQKTLGATPATGRGAAVRGAAWLGVALFIWLGHVWLVRPHHPFLAIPTLFLLLSSLAPLPLWLLPDRPGLTMARAINHACVTAFLLAIHLPFMVGD
jgi:dienelactone hydrolase